MRWLMAIVVFVTAVTAAIIVLAVMTFAPGLAHAADAVRDRPQGRMQACTAQWLDIRAEGQAPVYKTFIRECLAGKTAAPTVQAKAGRKKTGTGKGPSAVKLSAKVKKPNRMRLCAAQWRDMKAAGATGGQTYRQFSSQCLKAG